MEERKFDVFVQKTTIFLFLLVLLILFFYIVGNYQEFLDETQILLLKIERTVTMLLSVCLLFTALLNITHTVGKTGRKITVFFISLIGAALSLFLSVFVTFILMVVRPAV